MCDLSVILRSAAFLQNADVGACLSQSLALGWYAMLRWSVCVALHKRLRLTRSVDLVGDRVTAVLGGEVPFGIDVNAEAGGIWHAVMRFPWKMKIILSNIIFR
jgi:hypothetical protein